MSNSPLTSIVLANCLRQYLCHFLPFKLGHKRVLCERQTIFRYPDYRFWGERDYHKSYRTISILKLCDCAILRVHAILIKCIGTGHSLIAWRQIRVSSSTKDVTETVQSTNSQCISFSSST